jgi:uncharacterized protein
MKSTSPEKRITEFIKKHHVLTLATTSATEPWCCNCFYAYLEDENALVFTSDKDTRHVKEFLLNTNVAGSVVLETRIIGKIQGIQFTGNVSKPEGEMMDKCHKRYLRRFPYAALMETSLWILNLEYIKMTDNRLGFGKKLVWGRQ